MQPLTFGLTGREFQDTFNTEKYVAIACQQPRGKLLQQQVELNWLDWCDRVAQAPWRSYWKRSKYWKQPCRTPADQPCPNGRCGNVPLVIYSCAVWGFGIEGWLKNSKAPLYELLRLQELRDPKSVRNRTYLWDDKLYRGCGVQLPSEFGELDRWLEDMWQSVCKLNDWTNSLK